MLERSEKKNSLLLFGLYALTFLVGCYIMLNSPFVTDDYIFLANGSATFRQALDESLHYGNGRLLGNLTTILLLRSRPVMAAEKALIMVGIAALAARLTAEKKRENEPLYYLLAAVLLFGTSASIFAEVFSWTSGFQNYVPPILCALACAAAFLHEPKSKAGGAPDVALIVLFGVTGQLYMEMSSLINGLLAAAVAAFCAVKQRERLVKGVVWLGSTLVGGGLMALIPEVFPASSDLVETYRSLHLNGLQDILTTAIDNMTITVRGFFGCRVLIVLLCAAMLLYTRGEAGTFRRPKFLTVCRAGLFLAAVFGVAYDFLALKTELKKVFVLYDAVSMLSCFVFLACLIGLFAQMPRCREKMLLLCGAAGASVSLAPMMIVKPFGPRCLLLSYCFLAACVLLAAKLVAEQAKPETMRRATLAAFAAFAALAVSLGVIFTDIGWMSRQQIAYIESKMPEHPQQIEAIELPTDYVRTPCIWALNRVYYNEEQEDIEFIYLDFDEWYANRQAEGWIK